jgi:hypothetical protein
MKSNLFTPMKVISYAGLIALFYAVYWYIKNRNQVNANITKALTEGVAKTAADLVTTEVDVQWKSLSDVYNEKKTTFY